MGELAVLTLRSSSVRTSCRDQRMLDLTEMGLSLGLSSIGKLLKGVFHVLHQSSLMEQKSEGSRELKKASLTLVVVRVRDVGDIGTGW